MQKPQAFEYVLSVVKDAVRSRALLLGAALLLPYAGVLIGFDLAARYGDLNDARLPWQFFLSGEGGLGEWYEYAMTGTAAILLFLIWRAEREIAYLANAVLFFYLTLDNSLQLHEKAGDWFIPLYSGLTFIPVDPDQLGEATFLILVGLVWAITLAFCLKGRRMRPVVHSLMLAACIAGTALFGVFADLADSWGTHSPLASEIGNFVEDGGEFVMIIVCLLVTIAIYDAEKRRRATMR